MTTEIAREPFLSRLTLLIGIAIFLILAGCTAPQPQQAVPPTVTPPAQAAAAAETPPLSVSTAAPAPQATFPPGIRPVGQPYEYKDNYGKQLVGVRVRSYAVQNQYNYYYDDAYAPEAAVNAGEGRKFMFIGVTWDLLEAVGGGSRTYFITPNTTSYRLISRGYTYEPLYPFTLENPMHLYIKNQGTIVQEERIDKDNPGTGVLVFNVPSETAAKDSYVEFCPKPQLILTIIGEPHSPDYWDCTTNTIRWRLV